MPSQLLREYYATNPPGERRIITIETIHSTGRRCLVRGQQPVNLTLETGETKTFEPAGFSFQPPSRGVEGRQDINITISNTTLEPWEYLKGIIKSNRETPEEWTVIQRTYLASNTFEPCDEICRFSVTGISVDCDAVVIQGVFHNLINKLAFKHRYSIFDYPCLQYVT